MKEEQANWNKLNRIMSLFERVTTFSKRCWICIRMVRQPVIFVLLVIISSDNKTKKRSWGNQEWLILRDIWVNYAQVIRDMNQWRSIVHGTCYLPVIFPLFRVFNRGFSPRSLTPHPPPCPQSWVRFSLRLCQNAEQLNNVQNGSRPWRPDFV